MRLVVADASPLRYLVEISAAHLLRELYGRIVIPTGVLRELTATGTPADIKAWALDLPPWVEVRISEPSLQLHSLKLDVGETEALQLATSEPDTLLLIDERLGRMAAVRLGIAWIGTLGILREASDLGLIDLEDAVERLRKTNFRLNQRLIDQLLNR
ncbi:hypothetical protein F183_A38500 [Bryobacterales bacterium F-183]|nr:hypothetical protein F183_A38500 [Bryobacterales bacterium F-183]